MAPRPLRRPAHIPPLSSLLSQPGYSTGGTSVPLSASPHLVRPGHIVLLIDDPTSAAAATDHSNGTKGGWKSGLAMGRQPRGRVTKLSGLVFKETKENALSDNFSAESGPKTVVIHLLSSLPPTFPSGNDASRHFTLPTLPLGYSIRDELPAWLDSLALASKHKLTVEFNLEGYGSVLSAQDERDRLVAAQFEQVEELLSKSFAREFELSQSDQEGVQDGAETQRSADTAARFVLDAFGSPPTQMTSTQLLRSPQLQEWAGFCSRLALHPRVFVKLSPPPSSLVKSGGIKGMNKEDRSEFRRVVRIWIDAVLDALGEERLIFAATGLDATKLPASTSSASSSSLSTEETVQAVGGDDDDATETQEISAQEQTANAAREEEEEEEEEEERLTEVELWYELVREVLADVGIDALAMSKIFETNAMRLYGLL